MPVYSATVDSKRRLVKAKGKKEAEAHLLKPFLPIDLKPLSADEVVDLTTGADALTVESAD